MKNYCLLFIATFVSLNSVAAATRLKVAEVVGSYEYADNSSCTESETGLPCLAAFVTVDEQGRPFVEFADYGTKIALKPLSDRLVFKWVNSENDDCDDPGCWNLLGLSGVIYSKKLSRGGSVPAIKLYVKKDYPFPDEDDAPEGETTEVEKFVLRR
jgi:hypothetical protein